MGKGGAKLIAKMYVNPNKTIGMNRPFGSKDSPCVHCEDRKEGCHSSCVKYVAFSLAQDDQYDARAKNESKKMAAHSHVQRAIKKSKNDGHRTGYAKAKAGKRR